jgi:acylphosphatase
MITKKYAIFGKVQGVGFRYYIKKISSNYNITGYVKNLYDGSVEIIAQGTEENLMKFKAGIILGNGFSRVEDIKESDEEEEIYSIFSVKY